ncbi:WD40/YVTN/BNR-like repeat-containing protein [Pseudomonas sp. NPDC090202]|uniref:WD40/YVTN/BNR-like repeat-containing protein n=1 Tax=Pseudomonas sp. NPDC090202 TaxID=3364476 RepID=UPI00381D0575
MAAPTPIPELPVPPVRSDGPADFTAKADALMAALPPMVVNINSRLTWIWQQVLVVDDYRQQAATSAGNAQTYANAANSSKNAAAQSAIDATNNGAAQVALAAAQVALAQAARADAQSAAQAAGAAAGLPGGRVPYTVLQVNAAGNVSWGDGLIDKTAAVPGQALMLGSGKTPQWAFPGQQIGDVLISARNPGSLYLPANGGIRLKSAYPQLAALVGAINGVVGTNWANVAVAAAVNGLAASTAGTVIYSAVGVVYRSTDRGQTFGSAINLPISQALTSLETDGNGNWIGLSSANSGATQVCVYSNDDGLTWAQAAMPALTNTYAFNAIKFVGGNAWIAYPANITGSNPIARSTDGGKTWSTIATGLSAIVCIGASGSGTVVIAGAASTNYRISRSSDFGASFTLGANLGTSPGVMSIDTDKLGTWWLGTPSSSSGNVFRSLDDGLTFSVYSIFSSPGSSSVYKISYQGSKLLLITTGTPGGMSSFELATQILTTVSSGSIVSGTSYISDKIVDAGLGVLIGRSTTANNIARAAPQFPYDTATQFALPNITAPAGTTAYIKAKELA